MNIDPCQQFTEVMADFLSIMREAFPDDGAPHCVRTLLPPPAKGDAPKPGRRHSMATEKVQTRRRRDTRHTRKATSIQKQRKKEM